MNDVIFTTIVEIICAQRGTDVPAITRHTEMIDLGLDSLDRWELILNVEAHFAAEFTDAQIEELAIVDDLVLAVEAQVSASADA